MKTIIFSDTHLTDRFEADKFNYLFKLINSADRIVINGDFWDSHLTNFDCFISSPWKSLFPLLRQKRAIYIYGNHDPAEKCDDRIKLFSVKAVNSYILSQSALTYHLEHGHQLLQSKRPFLVEIYYSVFRQLDHSFLDKPVHRLLYLLESFSYKLIGPSLIANSKIAHRNNLILKKSRSDNNFLICSDTHLAEIDKPNKYVNTGYIGHGVASYCLIDGKSISLRQEKY